MSRYQIMPNKEYLKEQNKDQVIYYLKSEEWYGYKIYKLTNEVTEVNWINILAILNQNGALYIYSKLVVESYNPTPVAYPPFNQTIIELI